MMAKGSAGTDLGQRCPRVSSLPWLAPAPEGPGMVGVGEVAVPSSFLSGPKLEPAKRANECRRPGGVEPAAASPGPREPEDGTGEVAVPRPPFSRL